MRKGTKMKQWKIKNNVTQYRAQKDRKGNNTKNRMLNQASDEEKAKKNTRGRKKVGRGEFSSKQTENERANPKDVN